jgi:hypothetical protein
MNYPIIWQTEGRMALKCAFCDKLTAEHICHHCSKPVCTNHGEIIDDDPAFRYPSVGWLGRMINWFTAGRQNQAPPPPVLAVHCHKCIKVHRRFRWLLRAFGLQPNNEPSPRQP